MFFSLYYDEMFHFDSLLLYWGLGGRIIKHHAVFEMTAAVLACSCLDVRAYKGAYELRIIRMVLSLFQLVAPRAACIVYVHVISLDYAVPML